MPPLTNPLCFIRCFSFRRVVDSKVAGGAAAFASIRSAVIEDFAAGSEPKNLACSAAAAKEAKLKKLKGECSLSVLPRRKYFWVHSNVIF